MTIRTRFAPSPTGYMHIGGVRTALFAWLMAKQTHGSFILRIEDTDKAREVVGSEEHIIKTLQTLGLTPDEGPDLGGSYGPYRQSERLETYKQWGQKLLDIGRAYVDPYTKEELESFRVSAKLNKRPFLFRDFRPETKLDWDGTKPLRFLSDPKDYQWHDEIMGDLKAGSEAIDDFILIKSDGYPTYNFAHIIDDHLMDITLVIRSQEFLSSVPKFLNLYEALDIKRPELATVPPVLAPDGKRKLSKRDGAKDILEYVTDGYLPEAIVNFMASLGWNDGTTQETYTVEELIAKFKFKQVQKSGAKFDERRLLWMNGAHIRSLKLDDLYERSKTYWPDWSRDYPETYKKQVLGIIQDRLKFLAEIPELTSFFFRDVAANIELINNDRHLKDMSPDDLKSLLEASRAALEPSDFSLQDISERLNNLLSEINQKPAVLFSLIRIATTQSPSSPGLFDTLMVLGKDRTMKRIDEQIATL